MSEYPSNFSSAPARGSLSSLQRSRIDSLDTHFLKEEDHHGSQYSTGPSIFRAPPLPGPPGLEESWTSRDLPRPYDSADTFMRPATSSFSAYREQGHHHDLPDMASRASSSMVPSQSIATSPERRSSVSTFSLPPLTSWRANEEHRDPHGKHKSCNGCQCFGTLVHELADVTVLLLGDLGHQVEEPEEVLHLREHGLEQGELQMHISKFHRALRHLRSLRRNVSAQQSRDLLPRRAVSPSLAERRAYATEFSDSPGRSLGTILTDIEHSRKRSRLSSPGPSGTGRDATESSWRPAGTVTGPRGPESIISPTSPPSRQSPLPKSEFSFHPSAQFSGQHDMTRPGSLSGPSMQPMTTLSEDNYPTTLPPISLASVKSFSQPSSSAESTHYADLQRQITLKTLSLQTLQAEYSSLLQKLHRERLRSQTIERKSAVAESEVNALTTQNEDLLEQIKSLNAQVEACESKIETMRADYNRDKAQWVRILANNTKLMAHNADVQRTLIEENTRLEGAVHRLERALDPSDVAISSAAQLDPSPSSSGGPDEVISRLHTRIADLTSTSDRLRSALTNRLQDSRTLKQQVSALMETITTSDERHSRALTDP